MRTLRVLERFERRLRKLEEAATIDKTEINSILKDTVKELAIDMRDIGLEATFGREIKNREELRKEVRDLLADQIFDYNESIDQAEVYKLVDAYLREKGLSYLNRVSGLKESRNRYRNRNLREYEDPINARTNRYLRGLENTDRDFDRALDRVIDDFNAAYVLHDNTDTASVFDNALDSKKHPGRYDKSDLTIKRSEVEQEVAASFADAMCKAGYDCTAKDVADIAKDYVGEVVRELENAGVIVESRNRMNRHRRIAERRDISRIEADNIGLDDTSPEIVQAIYAIAKNDKEAARIWADPTEREIKKVLDKAWGNSDADELYWGDVAYSR